MKEIHFKDGVSHYHQLYKFPAMSRGLGHLVSCLLFFVLFSSGLKAQGVQQETVIRDWQTLYADPDNLGMSYRIVSCNGEVYVMLKLSSLKDQSAQQSFQLQVINISTNERISRNISVNLGARQQLITGCGENVFPDLKILLPRSFDASNLYVAPTF